MSTVATIRDLTWERVLRTRFEPDALAELAEWVWANAVPLARSSDRPTDPRPRWIGGSLNEAVSGPRCFLREWPIDERMARHTHPNGMLLMVLTGRLRVCEGARAQGQVRILDPGDRLIRVAESGGFDHFPHLLRPLTPTLSFHLYSDAPSRGRSISED